VSGEVVANQPDALGLRVEILCEAAYLFSELPAPPTLGHGRPAPTRQRLEGHQYVGHATPLVLVVAALEATRFARQGLTHLGEQLAGTLVEAHYRTLLVVGLLE
jgi:hypothetical protein